ncbi:hypothetical protein OIU76_026812 [Salix suchowensis]|nr:hypothetical protein OIU76_026812 [Salix suchowensis]
MDIQLQSQNQFGIF